MHDCYEDCPFYEQLQYAMDTRSSALFTYSVSGDDRLARQAILQLHNSFRPSIGLTASRAPANQIQIIPHFSLFWVCMVADHLEHFGDVAFSQRFTSMCDGVLETFARRMDPATGLVRQPADSAEWHFVDWTKEWKPIGEPPAAKRTGVSSYTNMLYAYTLSKAAFVAATVGRQGLAAEYTERGARITTAVQEHCFDGRFYTDGLAAKAVLERDYSQHSQTWAVLSGTATGDAAIDVLRQSLSKSSGDAKGTVRFTPVSTAMSFYALRALSKVGHSLYEYMFHEFWEPWRAQLGQNLNTWVEDDVTLRSDCHAWGCSILYEFTAEAAGVRPVGLGWSMVRVQPRTSLFPELGVRVPFTRLSQKSLVDVSWKQLEDENTVEIAVKILMDGAENSSGHPVVDFIYPNGDVEVITEPEFVRLISV